MKESDTAEEGTKQTNPNDDEKNQVLSILDENPELAQTLLLLIEILKT